MTTNKIKKERIDKILVEKGYFDTINQAQASIMAGEVKVNDEMITKAGFLIEIKPNTNIAIKSMPYVSRGGFKLAKAIKEFQINLKDKICLDCGASTGGFTDCMLQNGAKYVYAVDVGFNQIAWKFRNHKQVKNIEKTNIKDCKFTDIFHENAILPQFCSIDLSFIPLNKVLENIKSFLSVKDFEIVALIKPQFEANKEQVGNGVITDAKIHEVLINNVINYAQQINLVPCKLTYSPIKGPKGNIEYLILFKAKGKKEFEVKKIIEQAFLMLNSAPIFSLLGISPIPCSVFPQSID